MTEADGDDEDRYVVYEPSWLQRIGDAIGWLLGWLAYWAARFGILKVADRLVDNAIVLRRGNPGAIKAVGVINGRAGRLAICRGEIMISGRTGQAGPFPNSSFYATYHIAARNAARAMELIARWEWDAIPGSLKIENCELDLPDPGAEGILWVSNGRTFWTPDPDENDFEGRTE